MLDFAKSQNKRPPFHYWVYSALIRRIFVSNTMDTLTIFLAEWYSIVYIYTRFSSSIHLLAGTNAGLVISCQFLIGLPFIIELQDLFVHSGCKPLIYLVCKWFLAFWKLLSFLMASFSSQQFLLWMKFQFMFFTLLFVDFLFFSFVLFCFCLCSKVWLLQ